jgi:phenylalanyl-tRNA synthetase beta chain
MRFSYAWLAEFLETSLTPDELALELTQLGMEVEEYVDPRAALAPFEVAHIESTIPHPQADQLRICTVMTGAGRQQIVCGAPNARAGIAVVLAPIGAVIPKNGMVIKAATIRGVESHGMLCSADELGLGGDSEGIIELPNMPAVGTPLLDIWPISPVYEVNVTPNRGDCFSVRGIARDLAAAGYGTLKPVVSPMLKVEHTKTFPATILAPESCQRFFGCVITDIANVESPVWMQAYLQVAGVKPQSLVVDVTNYMVLSYGQPMHTYDFTKLTGGIEVRYAKGKETLRDLMGVDHILTPEVLVIADAKGPVAIAGAMGGELTRYTSTTTEIYLEVAHFAPIAVTKASRLLGIESAARQRFERNVNPYTTYELVEQAIALILQYGGGKAGEIVESGSMPARPKAIAFDPSLVAGHMGVALEHSEIAALLKAVGCEVDTSQALWQIIRPLHRPDLEIAEALAGEVVRLKGYANIPSTSLPPHTGITSIPETMRRSLAARRILAARGLQEIVSWSFMSEDKAAHFATKNSALILQNPITIDLAVMRPSALGNMLDALTHNRRRGAAEQGFFEIGPVYQGVRPEEQSIMATGIRAVSERTRHWQGVERDIDCFAAKADLLAVLAGLGYATEQLTILPSRAPSYFHPGLAAAVGLGPKQILGYFGALHPGLLTAWELDMNVVGFEVNFSSIPERRNKQAAYEASNFPVVIRDFAFIIPKQYTAQSVLAAVRSAGRELIERLTVFDRYEGEHVPEGHYSLAISLSLRSKQRTLDEQEISQLSEAVVAKVAAEVGGVLRGPT